MKQYKVGIIGGTGMVGQRFITLMEHHPWFQLTAIAATACAGPVTIRGAEAVRKSYPDFWEVYQSLGGDVHVL